MVRHISRKTGQLWDVEEVRDSVALLDYGMGGISILNDSHIHYWWVSIDTTKVIWLQMMGFLVSSVRSEGHSCAWKRPLQNQRQVETPSRAVLAVDYQNLSTPVWWRGAMYEEYAASGLLDQSTSNKQQFQPWSNAWGICSRELATTSTSS